MTHHAIHQPETLAFTVLGWTLMMAVMMAPTVAPWVMAFYRFGASAGSTANRVPTVLFVGGYFAVWSLFGLVVVLVQSAVTVPGGWNGLILAGAGLFQFTSLKQACLTHCRSPFSFLLARWKDGPRSAVSLGFLHGAYCLGCCWALMLTSLAVGVMSLWWMAGLAALTFIEQTAPWGHRLRVPIGLALIVAAGLSI